MPRSKNSLLNYDLEIKKFHRSLAPVVASVKKCRNEAKPQHCLDALSLISKNRKSLPRGYHDELWFLEGLVFEHQNNNTKALQAYEKSLASNMSRVETLFRKALMLEALKRHSEAIEVLNEFLWLSSNSKHEAQYLIGKNLCSIKKCNEGLAKVENSLKIYPRFIPALKFLVSKKQVKLKLLKDPAKIAELEAQIATDLFRLVTLEPQNRDATLELVRYSIRNADPLVHAQRLKDAENMTKRLVDQSSYTDTEAVRLLFDIYIRGGKTQEASAVLDKGLKVEPKAKLLLAARQQLDIQRQADATKKQEDQLEDTN